MSSVPPARCARHDLAPGPDGRCILCRRELQGAVPIEPPAEPSSLPRSLIVLAAAVLSIAGVAFALQAGGAGSVHPPSQPAAAALAPAPRPDPKPEPKPSTEAEREQTPAEQQAEAERQEAERDHALAEAQRAELKKRQAEAEAKAKLAAAESDKLRHERVARELANEGQASARRNVKITMYSTSWCRACKQARAYMSEHAIAFTDYDIEQDPTAARQQKLLNPRGSIPTISIDGDVLIGFSPSSLETRIDNAARKRSGG